MTTNTLAEQFRDPSQAAVARFLDLVSPPPVVPHGQRLGVARAAFPEPFAVLDALILAAEGIAPHVPIGVAAISRDGWPEQALIRVAVGDHSFQFFCDAGELMWTDHAGRSYAVRPDGTSPDEAVPTFEAFGIWLAGEVARLVQSAS